MRRRLLFAVGGGQRRRFAVCQQGEIEQAMGVVVGWAKQLAAGDPCLNPNFDLMKEDFTFDIKPLE